MKRFYSISKKKKRLDNSVLLPLDPTHIPCYGKRKKYACGMKRKRGTHYGYKNGVSVFLKTR
jgi:hypothetical protein